MSLKENDKYFVWMRGQKGPFPQLWHHLPTDGNGKTTAQALFIHKLKPDEMYLSLDKLTIKYADKAKP